MNADLSLRKPFYPRGMVWFTGEDLLGASSALARLTIVELEAGDVHTDRLSDFQHKHNLLPHAMADWLRWWKEHREMAKCVFENRDFEGRIYQINPDLHGRLPKQIALWTNMIEVLCYWLLDRGVLDDMQGELYSEASKIFIENAKLLQSRIQSSDPLEQFLEVVQSLKNSKKIFSRNGPV